MPFHEQPTILVTAFPPFDGTGLNSSLVVAQALNGNHIAGYNIATATLPNSFESVEAVLEAELNRRRYAAVIGLGQGDNSAVRLERVALNYADASLSSHADGDGFRPASAPVLSGYPLAYETKLPVQVMVKELLDARLPAEQSYFAGTHLCNYAYYLLLHEASTTSAHMPVLFLHIPNLDEQAQQIVKPLPTLSRETAVKVTHQVIELVAGYVKRAEFSAAA